MKNKIILSVVLLFFIFCFIVLFKSLNNSNKYIPKETVENLSTGQIRDKYTGKCCPWKSELDKYKVSMKTKLIHKRI